MAGKGKSKAELVRCSAKLRDGSSCDQLTPFDQVSGERWTTCAKHSSDLAHELGSVAVTSRLTLVAAPQKDSGDSAE